MGLMWMFGLVQDEEVLRGETISHLAAGCLRNSRVHRPIDHIHRPLYFRSWYRVCTVVAGMETTCRRFVRDLAKDHLQHFDSALAASLVDAFSWSNTVSIGVFTLGMSLHSLQEMVANYGLFRRW